MKALGLVRDLFFRSKIDAVAASAGADVTYAMNLEVARKRCAEIQPQVIFADLSDANFASALEIVSLVKALVPDARLIGYASHVDLKPLKAAREAGFAKVLSKQEFTAQLAELLSAQS